MNNQQHVDDKSRNIMLFDLAVRGHHPSYISYLIEYWCESRLAGKLYIVVTPKFLELHQEVVKTTINYQNSEVIFIPISAQEEIKLKGYSSPLLRAWRAVQEWQLFCQYACRLNITRGLLMYFDNLQVPFLLRKPPCLVSGIYFRPTFHYSSFANHNFSFWERLQTWREYFNLTQLFHHPQLQTIFCLDPLAVKHLQLFSNGFKAISLADPVKVYPQTITPSCLRNKLGISPAKKVFLLFGALSRRKGIYQLLEAIPLLTPKLRQQMCLLLVGSLGANQAQKDYLKQRLSELSKTLEVQIILQDKFVPETEIQDYFVMADVALAIYQKHVGMSGILNRAAISQTPVLSSDYGLMGELTRRYGLGIAIDSSKIMNVAHGLSRCLIESPEQWSDRHQMKCFAEGNSAQKFAQVICQNL